MDDDDCDYSSNQLPGESSVTLFDNNPDDCKVVFVPEYVIQALNCSESPLASSNLGESPDNTLIQLILDDGKKSVVDLTKSIEASLNDGPNSYCVEKIEPVQGKNCFSFGINREYFNSCPTEYDTTLHEENASVPFPDGEAPSTCYSQDEGLENREIDISDLHTNVEFQNTNTENSLAVVPDNLPELCLFGDAKNSIDLEVLKNADRDQSVHQLPLPDVCSSLENRPEGNYEILFQISNDTQSYDIEQDLLQKKKGTSLKLATSIANELKPIKTDIKQLSEQRTFKCTFEGCKWAFTTSYKLNRHLSSHFDGKPFACTFPGCNKSFRTASYQKAHTKTHFKEAPNSASKFPCKSCHLNFSTKRGLALHKYHSHNRGKTRYTCPYCDKVYDRPCTLKQHMYVHSGEKPFKCDECEWMFTSMAALKRHQLTHDKTKTRSVDDFLM